MESHESDATYPALDPTTARAALDEAASARAAMAGRAASPAGYYLVLGVASALVMVGLSARGQWWGIALIVAAALLLALDMWWYTRHTGIVALATLREPGAWAAWSMIGTIVLGVAVSAGVGDLWVSMGCGVVTLLVTGVVGPIWDRAWVRSVARQP